MAALDLCAVLRALMSTNNAQRREAEAAFEGLLAADLRVAIRSLLTVLETSTYDAVLRTFSAVLLRRTVERGAEHLSDQDVEALKVELLGAWRTIADQRLSLKLSHVLAQTSFKRPWEALLPSVLEFAMNNAPHALPALNLLEIIADYCPEDVNAHSQIICQFLARFLSSEIPQVRMSCAKATATCIAVLEEDNVRNSFRAAVDPILAVLGQALADGEEADATTLLENLVTVAQIQPVFFKPALDKMVACMLSVAGAEQLEFSTRIMALEWLITMAETAPALVRRCSGFIVNAVGCCMKIMMDVDDDVRHWAQKPYNLEDEDENGASGDDAIERLATSLGGKSISEAVLSAVTQFSAQPRWQAKRAAVAGLCRLAEGTTKTFEQYLPQVVPFLDQCLQDASQPRVQYEGIQTVGRLASLYTERCGDLLAQFLPRLATLLQDTGCCARVRGHAASALINLVTPDHCEADMLRPFLAPLLQGLLVCLQSAPFEVRGPCLVVLGCVAQVCPDEFAGYYGQFMPGVKGLLREARGEDMLQLRGKAIECAGLIGEAVGTKSFAQDAREIVQIFIETLQADTDRDISFEYVLPACARLSKALGADFAVYLPVIYGPLLEGANQEVQFSMEDADDDEAEGEVVADEDTGVQSTVVAFGAGVKKRVSINTHAVQQKQQAARVFFELAEALGPHLGPYIVPSLQALTGLVGMQQSSDIRASAALALSKMFHAYLQLAAATTAGAGAVAGSGAVEMFQLVLRQLIVSLRAEPDATTRICLAECMRDVLQSIYDLGRECEDGRRRQPFAVEVSQAEAAEIVGSALTQCAECVLRFSEKERHIAQNADKFDEEDLAGHRDELDEEQDLLAVLVDVFGQMLKLQGAAFMPAFDQVVAPAFSSYMLPDKPVGLQTLACCLLDDCLEFGGEAAHKYLPSALQAFLRNAAGALQDELDGDSLVLVQCSVYGLAVAVRCAPEAMASAGLSAALGQAAEAFVSILRSPACADDKDRIGIAENAAYGLGCLLCLPAYRTFIASFASRLGATPKDLVKLWLARLPLSSDEVEAKDMAWLLAQALAARSELVCGASGERVQAAAGALLALLDGVEGGGCAGLRAAAAASLRPLVDRLDSTLRARLQALSV